MVTVISNNEQGEHETDAAVFKKDDSFNYADDDTESYNVDKFKKNYMIIFNTFQVKGQKPRVGSEQDVLRLKQTFKSINFEVEEHSILTKESILEKMNEFKTRDCSDYGCVAVVVMTHGDINGELLDANGYPYNEEDILDPFKTANITLNSKAKLFIFQTCRGGVYSTGKIESDSIVKEARHVLPPNSDTLILHSTYFGKKSARNLQSGTWFIQTLCDKIDKYAAGTENRLKEFNYIITDVFRYVAIDKTAILLDNTLQEEKLSLPQMQEEINSIRKQQPVVTSTLTRELYFFKSKDDNTLKQTVDTSYMGANRSTKKDESAAFLDYVASKYRKYNNYRRSGVEYSINNILYYADKGKYFQVIFAVENITLYGILLIIGVFLVIFLFLK